MFGHKCALETSSGNQSHLHGVEVLFWCIGNIQLRKHLLEGGIAVGQPHTNMTEIVLSIFGECVRCQYQYIQLLQFMNMLDVVE